MAAKLFVPQYITPSSYKLFCNKSLITLIFISLRIFHIAAAESTLTETSETTLWLSTTDSSSETTESTSTTLISSSETLESQATTISISESSQPTTVSSGETSESQPTTISSSDMAASQPTTDSSETIVSDSTNQASETGTSSDSSSSITHVSSDEMDGNTSEADTTEAPASTTFTTRRTTTTSATIPQTKPPDLEKVKYNLTLTMLLKESTTTTDDQTTLQRKSENKMRAAFGDIIPAFLKLQILHFVKSESIDQSTNYTVTYSVFFSYLGIQDMQLISSTTTSAATSTAVNTASTSTAVTTAATLNTETESAGDSTTTTEPITSAQGTGSALLGLSQERVQIQPLQKSNVASVDEKLVILAGLINQVFQRFKDPHYFDPLEADIDFLDSINITELLSQMLSKDICEIIKENDEPVCEMCYLHADCAVGSTVAGVCKFECPGNQQCLVTDTSNDQYKTECRCADKYLPVGDDCVHEGIIIGCSTAAAGILLIALIGILVYSLRNRNKANKYRELSRPHDNPNWLSMETEYQRSSRNLNEYTTFVNPARIEEPSENSIIQSENNETARTETDQVDSASARQDYWNVPPEILQSSTFRDFSPCLDDVDTTIQYKLARAKLADS